MYIPGYGGSDPQTASQDFSGVVRTWTQQQGWLLERQKRTATAQAQEQLIAQAAILAGTVDANLEEPLADIAALKNDMELVKGLLMELLSRPVGLVLPGDAQ